MRSLFRRLGAGGDAERSSASSAPPASDDSPEALMRAVASLVAEVNRSAGRLPTAAVVNTRALLDTVQEVVESSAVRPLDVHAVIAVRGILEDYLPTTLRAYLAVDPDATLLGRHGGPSAQASLLAQLHALTTAATATLDAVRDQDAAALMTQDVFLRTKFSRSDLDL